MKTYSVKNQAGMEADFEIENAYISPKSIAALLGKTPQITNIQAKNLSHPEYRVEFKYCGIDCVVWEPFGDNSRYWIGPKDKDSKIDISEIREIFDKYSPPLLMRMLGDIVTLKLFQKSS